MARYTGPSCRLCRREGGKLFLKGTKCVTDKCPASRREFAPGMHGKGRKKESDYNTQLREKQKVKRIYGMLERQFRHYFKIASEAKGETGPRLLELLERRLDNVIFRICMAQSRQHARQMVQHGQVYVNDHRLDIPAYTVRLNDEIEIRAKEKTMKLYRQIYEASKDRGIPKWITFSPEQCKAKIVDMPKRDDVGFPVKEQLIVELYSK